MVEVGAKEVVRRVAKARATVRMGADTVRRIREGAVPKGDVLASARAAAYLAMKATPSLLPMCHPISISVAEARFDLTERSVRIETEVRALDRTGVEMEALTGAAVAALCVWDMCKGIDDGLAVEEIVLVSKTKEPL